MEGRSAAISCMMNIYTYTWPFQTVKTHIKLVDSICNRELIDYFHEMLLLVMLGFINYCVTGREAIELSMSIIFLSQGETAPRYIWTKYDLVWTTAYLIKISCLLQLALTLCMLADTSWKTAFFFFFFRFRHVSWDKYITVLKQNFYKVSLELISEYHKLISFYCFRFMTGFLLVCIFLISETDSLFFCQWNYIIVPIQEAAWLCQNMSVICSFCDFKYCLSNNPALFTSILK